MIGFNAQNWIVVFLFCLCMGVLAILYASWMKKHEDDDKNGKHDKSERMSSDRP